MRDVVDGVRVSGHGEVRMGRRFTPEYKLRILAELDAAEDQGAKGAIVRRERLHWSTVSRWRAKRDVALREGLKEGKRGPKVDRLARELREVRERNERLEERLRTVEELAEAQGKAFALLQTLSRKSDDDS